MQVTDDLSAPDDRSIQFRLSRPFALLPDALGKVGTPMPAMMPERLANTDPFKQITEIVGSGPYRYLANERVQGSRNVYARFDKYRPREGGTPDWTAGPKIVHFDRVEWTTIPDASTAAAAVQSGEQDWWEYLTHDLMSLMRKNPKVRVSVPDPTGYTFLMRPNHLQPPFNNRAIRRALLGAIDQTSFMQAIVGDNPDMFYTPVGVFTPGTPMASKAGLDAYVDKRDYDRVKQEIKAAGYAGERTVLLVPTDSPRLKLLGDVAADMMHRVGFNVDYAATDFGTLIQRRTNKGPVEQGGWSAFLTGGPGESFMTPADHIVMRGNGDQPSALAGWYVSPRIEALRNNWFAATTAADQQKICADIQQQCMIDVPFYSLGQLLVPTAYRADLTGMLNGFATFWNIRRTA